MPELLAATALTATYASAAGPAIVAISYGALLQAGVAIGGSMALRASQRSAARRQFNTSLQDRTTPVRQSDAARTIVYGRTRVSGPIVYHRTHGARREVVSHVIALAGHELAGIDDVWFNDKSIAPWPGIGAVTSGSPFFARRDVAHAHQFTGGAAGSTVALPPHGGSLRSVDTVSRTATTTITQQQGEGDVVLDRWSEVQLVAGTDYSVGGPPTAPTLTLLNGAALGQPVTVTYRVDVGDAYAQVYAFLGIPAGQRDTLLEGWSTDPATGTPEWPADAIGCNVARLHVVTVWEPTLYATGFPSVSAIVRGKKVYDPRLDSTNGGSGTHRADIPTTWAYSDNPALCAADYLRDTLGFGCSSAEIDWPSVIAAANTCDELVPIDGATGTQKRYTVAGVLSTETERKANLEALLDAMVGSAVYSGGRWTLRAGAYALPTLDLDESDLAAGDVNVQARANRRDLFNAVRGRYREPTQLYQVVDFPPYASSTYAAEDGGEVIYREIDLPMVDDARRAQRIGKLLLFRARQALTIQASFKLSAYALQPGDTCRLTIARYGWANKVFRVLRREFSSLSTVRLTLQEDAAAIYAWNFNEASVPDPAPNSGLPDPRYVASPRDVVFRADASTYYALPDQTVIPYVEVSWTRPTQDDVRVELYWKRTHETEYRRVVAPIGATYAWIEGVRTGDVINAYLVAVNEIGARSMPFWQPRYVVGQVTRGASGGVAVNWIENSSLVNSIDGWVTQTNPNLELRHLTATALPPVYTLSGTPPGKGSGLFLFERGDRPANGVSDATVSQPDKHYAVEAGQRIEGSAYLCTHRATADLRVAFYRADGSYLTEFVLWGPGSVNDGSTLQTLAQYGRRGGFATVPAGAARAMLFARKFGRNAGAPADGSYLFATRWMLGPAIDGQTELSPWSDGALREIATADLVPGATGNSFARTAPADLPLPVNNSDTPLLSISYADVGARPGDHLVYRVTGTLSSTTDLARVGLRPTQFSDSQGRPVRSGEWVTLPAGTDQQFVIEDAFTVGEPGKSGTTLAFYASVRAGAGTLHLARMVVQIHRR